MEQELQRIVKWISGQTGRVIIGISGHGASGKTTFASHLISLLGQENVNLLNTDPYIIGSSLRKYAMIDYEYHNEQYRDKMTACHLLAHNVAALERDIRMLRDGLGLYTMDTHYTKSTLLSSRNKINIVEGMSVAFTDPGLYDLKVYLHTDGETELRRRGIRDVAERGTDIGYLMKSHEQRRIQYELFMHPYHEKFEIVIRNQEA
ncbi:phosphoribulokinase [Paenibacillus sp. FSL H8-0122]|uniref:uridine kinase family protein n=1 Tax=Paenibacillus sp. FSL H8-0122 TaxID=2954510 RepID=UPI0030F83755